MNEMDEEDADGFSHTGLEHLTLQEIQQLRDKIGIKQFNKKYGRQKGISQRGFMQKKKRSKDSGPMEMSSKRPSNNTSTLRKKPVTRDPRFDDLSGQYNEQIFKRSYKFIDRLKAKEMKAVRKIADDEEMDEETRKKAKDMLTRMGQKKNAKKEMSAASKVEQALKDERKKAIKEGHKPYFLKDAEKKKLVLAEKYKDLKKKGQLDAFMKKKRKTNAKKDTRMIRMSSAR
ncbi:ribosomal RNA processing protein 36 homolog isoform X2 [Watersipora subatra]